jgi:hypothetical protein
MTVFMCVDVFIIALYMLIMKIAMNSREVTVRW